MAVGPLSPVQIHLRASGDVGVERSWRGADNATRGVAAALEISKGHVFDWTVALYRSGDALGGRAHVGVLVRLVEGECLATNSGSVDVAMAGDGGGQGKSSGGVLHCKRTVE